MLKANLANRKTNTINRRWESPKKRTDPMATVTPGPTATPPPVQQGTTTTQSPVATPPPAGRTFGFQNDPSGYAQYNDPMANRTPIERPKPVALGMNDPSGYAQYNASGGAPLPSSGSGNAFLDSLTPEQKKLYNENLTNQMSGDAYDPMAEQTRMGNTKQYAAERADQANRIAGMGLEGSPIAHQLAKNLEGDIMEHRGQSEINVAVERENLKRNAQADAYQLATGNESVRQFNQMSFERESDRDYNRNMDMVKTLLATGGDGNLSQASQLLGQMFPGTSIDLSNITSAEKAEAFGNAMSSIGKHVATGTDAGMALKMLKSEGVFADLGMTDSEFKSYYDDAVLKSNPVYQVANTLTDEQLTSIFPDMEADAARASITKMSLFGGLSMNEDGTFSVDHELIGDLFGEDIFSSDGDGSGSEGGSGLGGWTAFNNSQQDIPEGDRVTFSEWQLNPVEKSETNDQWKSFNKSQESLPDAMKMDYASWENAGKPQSFENVMADNPPFAKAVEYKGALPITKINEAPEGKSTTLSIGIDQGVLKALYEGNESIAGQFSFSTDENRQALAESIASGKWVEDGAFKSTDSEGNVTYKTRMTVKMPRMTKEEAKNSVGKVFYAENRDGNVVPYIIYGLIDDGKKGIKAAPLHREELVDGKTKRGWEASNGYDPGTLGEFTDEVFAIRSLFNHPAVNIKWQK
jgi:hypothetical protein